MGCEQTKSENGKASPIASLKRPARENSLALRSLSTNGARETISSARDFKISHADFIAEKTGRISDDYKVLLPPIGRGAFGEVRRAVQRKTNQSRAIKIIYKESYSSEEQQRIINEVDILKTLDHPNIMRILEFYQDDRNFYIVSELYTGGELFDKISELKVFTEAQAAGALRQILSAVYYCHQNKIVHRDIKPENILYESKKPGALLKVIDFGTSKVFDDKTKMSQKLGTPYYIAPEVLKRRYTEKCDIWSCGVILYILLSGKPPFNGPNDKVILEKVAAGRLKFDGKEWLSISEAAKGLILHMLEIDPKLRYSAENCINDPWIKKHSSEEIDKPLAISALQNLKTFRAERKLQEAVWIFLVTYMATRDEKNELLKTFQALDLNGDGQLTREELVEGYEKILLISNAEEEVDNIMKTIDKNGNGAIDYTEFVIATINRQTILSKERLEAAFRMFDKDGNGYITADELRDVLSNDKDVKEEVWLELIKEVDQNSDGQISYKEFKDMMKKFLV